MVLVGSSQPNKVFKFFIVQNCIKLEPDFFKIRLLDFLVQNIGHFTTPIQCRVHSRKRSGGGGVQPFGSDPTAIAWLLNPAVKCKPQNFGATPCFHCHCRPVPSRE